MSNDSNYFISFAKEQMRTQGDKIRAWVNDPFIGEACREIMRAAEIKEGGSIAAK